MLYRWYHCLPKYSTWSSRLVWLLQSVSLQAALCAWATGGVISSRHSARRIVPRELGWNCPECASASSVTLKRASVSKDGLRHFSPASYVAQDFTCCAAADGVVLWNGHKSPGTIFHRACVVPPGVSAESVASCKEGEIRDLCALLWTRMLKNGKTSEFLYLRPESANYRKCIETLWSFCFFFYLAGRLHSNVLKHTLWI